MRFITTFVTSIIAVGLAGPVFAQPPDGRGQPQDGRVSPFAAEALAPSLTAADTNGDGKISPDEYMAMLIAGGYRRADGGMPTKTAIKDFFDKRDTNHDGFIDAAEHAAPPPGGPPPGVHPGVGRGTNLGPTRVGNAANPLALGQVGVGIRGGNARSAAAAGAGGRGGR